MSGKATIAQEHRELMQQLASGNGKKAVELVKHHLDDG